MTMLMMMLMMMATTTDSGIFRGVRYVKNNDYAVVLLFDVNGYIAGMQCAVRILSFQKCWQVASRLSQNINFIEIIDHMRHCLCVTGTKAAYKRRENHERTRNRSLCYGVILCINLLFNGCTFKSLLAGRKKKRKEVPFHPAR